MKCGNCDGKGRHPNQDKSWWRRLIWKTRECFFCEGAGELSESQASFYMVLVSEIYVGTIKRHGYIPSQLRHPVHITPHFRKGGPS